MFDSLRSVSPQQILSDTDSIVAQDRRLTLRLLEHLHEIDRRKLYLECGFGSLFDYCTKHLKLAEPSAARRIRTARCVARYPQLYPLLESGELSLTVVSMMSKHIKPENVDEVINQIKGKSKREVERIIAEYEPRAAVPADRTRRMVVPVVHTTIGPVTSALSPAPVVRNAPLACVAAAMPVPRSTSASAAVMVPVDVACSTAASPLPHSRTAGANFTVTGDSEKSPNDQSMGAPGPMANDDVPARSDNVESMRADKNVAAPEPRASENLPAQFERLVRVEFTAHEALMKGLEQVRSIASHRLAANATLEQLFAFVTEYFLEKEDPARRQARREARAIQQEKSETTVATPPAISANARHVPAQVRDQVFVRDSRCTFVSPDGQRCGSTHVLQIDHIKPVARGGASTIDNLRLLCAYHNRLESERLMGKRGCGRNL